MMQMDVLVQATGDTSSELRPESWTQKLGFLNNIGGGLLGQPLRLKFGWSEIA